MWIVEEDREKAERLGCTVVDPPSIIATHLTEIIKRYASEILGRQEVQSILEALKTEYSAVVEEVRKSLAVGEIQKVLQGLLSERVSVRNMVVILETLADYGSVTKDVGFLVEKVRQALGRQICLQYCDDRKTMRVLTIEPSLEKAIIDSRLETNRGIVAGLDPATAPTLDHGAHKRRQGGPGAGSPRGGALLGGGPAACQVEHGPGDPAPRGDLQPRGRGGHRRGIPRGNSSGRVGKRHTCGTSRSTDGRTGRRSTR